MGDAVPDWEALQTDVLGYITNFLPLIEDFMAFRGVCTSWRAAATKDNSVFVGKVPLLMLAEKDGSNVREFYSLSKRKICLRIPLPLDTVGRSCIDVGFGWIMTLDSSGEVCLLKPFSSARTIKLPNVKTFPNYEKNCRNPVFKFLEQAVLTANPSETPNFTLIVSSTRRIGFWRNGDPKYGCLRGGITMAYCKGKVHTLLGGHVLTWDPHGTDLTEPQGKVKVDNVPTGFYGNRRHYLVGSTDGELLLIERNNTGPEEYFATGADHFGVMRIDLVKVECKEINGLGKDAIFLGNNAAVAVDATEFPGVLKPNCIYFTDDCIRTYFHSDGWYKGGGKDTGIYNVGDRSIERFNVESFSRVCPPLWVFPSF